jgi:predicted Mrr-cat superfamily restriction endonuclease
MLYYFHLFDFLQIATHFIDSAGEGNPAITYLFFFLIRLWDQGALLNEIVKHYEQFDDELKAELPLKRIWTLVEEEY